MININKHMNYKKQYDTLINRARNRIIEGYTENHHIIPTCMDGDSSADNLVALTGREHFIAHILLLKIYPNVNGLIFAVHSMCRFNKKMDRSKNRMYGWLREQHAKTVSRINKKKQTGKKNSQYGSCWISHIQTTKNKKIKLTELDSYLSLGWLRGRNKKKILCGECNIQFVPLGQEKLCSDSCRMKVNQHAREKQIRPNIVLENFNELYAEYLKTGSFYKAFTNLEIGYNNSVYDRFRKEIKKHIAGIA